MTPTVYQPIEWAFIELSPASPSVNNRVSSLHPPVFFWVWGESHASTLTKTYTIDSQCGDSHISISEFGTHRIEGTLSWSLAGESRTQSLDAHSPQPLSNPLSNSTWKNLSTTPGPNTTANLPPFSISFQGQVVMPYMQEVEEHYLVTYTDSKGNTISHCETAHSSKIVEFALPVGSRRTYGVEHGEPLFLKLRPADKEQLSLASGFERVDISNRLPYDSNIFINSTSISSSRYAHYQMLKDEAGFWSINRTEGADTQWTNAPATPFPPSMFINYSNAFLLPVELDAANRSFAYQYFHDMKYPFPLGDAHLNLKWTDDFMDNWSADYDLLTHAPVAVTGTHAEAAGVAAADERLAAPAIQSSSTSRFATGLVKLALPSSSNWRETSAIFFNPVLLPLGIGIIGLAGLGFYVMMRMRKTGP